MFRRFLLLSLVIAFATSSCRAGIEPAADSTTSIPETTPAESSTTTTTTVTVTTTTVTTTTTTLPPTTINSTMVPATTVPSVSSLEAGLYCRDLKARGYDYPAAIAYWVREGFTDRMDADRNGIPCETVWPSEDVAHFWRQAPPSTTTPPPPVEIPAACSETPQGVTSFANPQEYRDALVGRWFLCNPGSPSAMYHPLGGSLEGVIGVEFLADGRYRYLGGTAAEPVAMTGWGNEGSYTLIEDNPNQTRTAYQVDFKPDAQDAWFSTFIEFSADLRFFAVGTYNGNSKYLRLS